MGGQVSYLAGKAAEDAVARIYARSGRAIAASRWRGASGEIDLIARDGGEVIFIEVKQSRSHAEAAEHLTRRQMGRIYAAAANSWRASRWGRTRRRVSMWRWWTGRAGSRFWKTPSRPDCM